LQFDSDHPGPENAPARWAGASAERIEAQTAARLPGPQALHAGGNKKPQPQGVRRGSQFLVAPTDYVGPATPQVKSRTRGWIVWKRRLCRFPRVRRFMRRRRKGAAPARSLAQRRSYSIARSAIVSPAAYRSAILRRWPASRAQGRPNLERSAASSHERKSVIIPG
jgi:hypothetical protein